MKKKQALVQLRKRGEKGGEEGFTLLEYTAGAAVLLVLVMVGLQAFGNGLGGVFESLGGWAGRQSTQIDGL
ncbi:MAG: hypothetical protein KDD64_01545 [Bdellovibrionales bacterium]|nr:hypothetical protein [Bdellovibrionales bacterium]